MKNIRFLCSLIFIASVLASGCDSKKADSAKPDTAMHDEPIVTSSDLVGSWKVDFVSGTSHPMVGGVLELTDDGRMISYDASGVKQNGESSNFWHFLRMESGQAIIAMDTFSQGAQGDSSALAQLEMPVAVILDGDKMTWNILTREEGRRATPSDKVAYKFTRK